MGRESDTYYVFLPTRNIWGSSQIAIVSNYKIQILKHTYNSKMTMLSTNIISKLFCGVMNVYFVRA